ncbi:endonuclease/exonuclease/phosphatase family protein [Methylorubrum thiocyanatum]|uniref:endonuclease/exonuclease/phosphatase family protein n=1 Tax=Methylorubrum thiocyanatum TaxID=47958 RepID=UPI0035C81ACD
MHTEKVSFLEALDTFIAEKRAVGRPLVLVGDFNVAHTEIDLANPAPSRGNPGSFPRSALGLTGCSRRGS